MARAGNYATSRSTPARWKRSLTTWPAGHDNDPNAPIFLPVRANAPGASMDSELRSSGVYRMIKLYAAQVGISVARFGPHAARATAYVKFRFLC